ncbi:hypothetical protein ACL9RF_05180 [Sphingobacterium sp. Mn56C]|uniref:hypothetical protein n=1 Tax=Sphingobacterium sp. Mn56C TaxID=3395261 RepID=UPI003BEDD4E0
MKILVSCPSSIVEFGFNSIINGLFPESIIYSAKHKQSIFSDLPLIEISFCFISSEILDQYPKLLEDMKMVNPDLRCMVLVPFEKNILDMNYENVDSYVSLEYSVSSLKKAIYKFIHAAVKK